MDARILYDVLQTTYTDSFTVFPTISRSQGNFSLDAEGMFLAKFLISSEGEVKTLPTIFIGAV